MANVKPWLVGTIEYIFDHGDESLKNQVLSGEISPSAAHEIIKSKERREEEQRLSREASANKDSRNSNKRPKEEQRGVIIKFPERSHDADSWRDDYLCDYDYSSYSNSRPSYSSSYWENRSQSINTNYSYQNNDSDDEYEDEEYEDSQYSDRKLYQNIGENSQVILSDIHLGPSIHDIRYIQSKFRAQCFDFQETAISYISNIQEENVTEADIEEIKDTITTCCNQIFSRLDDICKNRKPASCE